MKTNNKRTLIVAGIIFITVINLAALGTQLYHSYFQPRFAERIDRNDRNARSREFNHERFHSRFAERMGFSDEQEQAFRKISRETFQQSRPIIDQLNLKRRELLDQLTQESVDSVQVSLLSEEIGRLHAELKKISAAHYLALKELCTPEQQSQLLEFYDRMIPQGPGREGRGRNRRSGNFHDRDKPERPRRMTSEPYFEY